MKKLFLIACTLPLLFSCLMEKSEEVNSDAVEIIDNASLRGKFIRTGDNDRAGIESNFKLIREIEFKGNYCHFTYASIKMSGKYEIDENYIYINTESELGILALEVKGLNHLEGEGFIHGTFQREGSFTPKTATKKQHNSKESANESEETSNPASHDGISNDNSTPGTDQSNNPFGSYEDNSGSEDYFSGGTGTGGDGSGEQGRPNDSPSGRKIIKDIDGSSLHSNHDAHIYLKVVVDANGNVVYATNMNGKTTTTDQILINKVKTLVKNQVKYEKMPGSALMTMQYAVRIYSL